MISLARLPPNPLGIFLSLVVSPSCCDGLCFEQFLANRPQGRAGLRSGLEIYERDGDEKKLPFLLNLTEVKLLGMFYQTMKAIEWEAHHACLKR